MLRKLSGMALSACMLLGVPFAVAAEELTVATPNDPSIDPHYLYVSTNTAYARHLFGKLLDRGPDARIKPDLAESWRMSTS